MNSEFVKHHTANILFFLTRYFGDTHHLRYKKLNAFAYIYIFVKCLFFQITHAGCLIKPYKAENWDALSHGHYFSTHRF